MLGSIGRRLRIALRQPQTAPPSPADEGPAEAALPEVEFVAYAEDCRLSGRIRLETDRLSDMLNLHDEYELRDVLAESLATGEGVEAREIVLSRDDLLLVHATGPRGDQARRQRTRPHPVAIQIGPYHVRGYLHAFPGADPILAMRRRKPMVPLTDAWIEHSWPGGRQRIRVGTVVINRELVDWVVPALDDEVEMPDLPLKADKGPLVKDFTGSLFA